MHIKKHLNWTANTRCKNVISFDKRTDREKSIILDQKARNWELYDGAEDSYTDADMDQSPESARTTSFRLLHHPRPGPN